MTAPAWVFRTPVLNQLGNQVIRSPSRIGAFAARAAIGAFYELTMNALGRISLPNEARKREGGRRVPDAAPSRTSQIHSNRLRQDITLGLLV